MGIGTLMGIEAFAEEVKEGVEKRLGENCSVTVCSVDQNNGVAYTGLCVKKDRASVSPVIYIDSHYDGYKNGRTTSADTADYVLNACMEKRHTVDMRCFLNYGNVREKIVYKLINTEKNREILKDLPHVEFLDLSIVFQCMVHESEEGTATVLIHNAHAKLWGASADELYQAAARNTPGLCGYSIKGLRQVICEILNREIPDEEFEDEIPLYMLSSRNRINGAACILYPNILREFSDMSGGGFYIIPSSVHEVLLLPADNTEESGKIREMIREINDTHLAAEEILSYSLYYYDRGKDKVRIVQ